MTLSNDQNAEASRRPALDTEPPAMLVLRDGRIVEASRTAEHLLGILREDLIGADLAALAFPPEPGSLGFGEPDRSTAFLRRIMKPDGGAREVEVTLVPLPRLQGDCAVAILRDVESPGRTTPAARSSREAEVIGQLAAGIARELNDQLVGILEQLDLARRSRSPVERPPDELTRAKAWSERAAALSRRLVALGERHHAEPAPVSLSRIVQDVASRARREIGEGIRIEVVTDPILEPIVACSLQIEQALLALVGLARNAVPSGGAVTLTTSSHVVEEEFVRDHPWVRAGAYARVEVRHTGGTLPPDLKPHIFDTRYASSPGQVAGAFGISLACAVVKHHRGFIHLESSAGQGTVLSMDFPSGRAVADSA